LCFGSFTKLISALAADGAPAKDLARLCGDDAIVAHQPRSDVRHQDRAGANPRAWRHARFAASNPDRDLSRSVAGNVLVRDQHHAQRLKHRPQRDETERRGISRRAPDSIRARRITSDSDRPCSAAVRRISSASGPLSRK
jgi:hypothetical protein